MAPFTLHTPGPSGSAEVITFSVPPGPVAFAGSRNSGVSPLTCSLLFQILSSLDFSFMTGCASGVDHSFRDAMTDSIFTGQSLVACAFKKRFELAQAQGLNASFVTSPNLHPVPALRNRTIWLVDNSVMLFLFPDDPKSGQWGKGSTLAFNTAVKKRIPIFTVTTKPPPGSLHYYVIKNDFFGIIQGYWIIPADIIEENHVA